MSYRDENNTGLSWRFQLSTDGSYKTYNKWVEQNDGTFIQVPTTVPKAKFQLIGGSKKADDNVTMMLGFIGWFRVYYQDFVPQVLELIQKPTSTVYSLRSIIVGKLRKSINKYIPIINVKGVSMVYDYRDKKLFTIALDYDFNLEERDTFTVVRFLQI